MDVDVVLGAPRWKILELLAESPLSPLEISGRLKTSVSYVSQQLKLLEVAGLIKKEKTGEVEKGKPRSVYSLNKEFVFISAAFNGGSVRKQFSLDDHRKTILNIWNVSNSFYHYHLEKFYWGLEGNIDEVKGIFCKPAGNKMHVVVICNSAKGKNLVSSVSKDFSAVFKVDGILEKQFDKKNYSDFSPIYDPEFILGKLKGGDE